MPNQFLDVTTFEERIINKKKDSPAQGQQFFNGEIGLKTVNIPFKASSLTSSGNLLAARLGIRYYIHSVSIHASQVAATAATANYVAVSIDGNTAVLADVFFRTGAIQSQGCCNILDVITDVNTAVVFSLSADTGFAVVTYREIQGAN